MPDLLSNVQDVEPEMSEVYIEVLPEDKKPLEPQVQERVITDLGQSPGSYIPNTLFPEQREGKVLKEQPRVSIPKKVVRTLEAPKMPRPKESVGQRLPKHILPRYILRPGQPFLYEIPKDSTDEFYSFRWDNQPPKGMYFLYDSKSINWVPTDKQLDAFPISYMARMKVDEIMEAVTGTNEEEQVFKATPVLESREEGLWIYVNDPPRFLTKPTITEFIAGSTFRYEPIVQDRNKDASIKFELEVAKINLSHRVRMSAHSLDTGFQCLRRHWLEHVKGWSNEPIYFSKSDFNGSQENSNFVSATLFGTIVHRLLEIGLKNPSKVNGPQ